MAESGKSTLKSAARKTKNDKPGSSSFLQYSSSYLGSVNSGRLSLASNARVQKLASCSSERLSYIIEEDASEIENYHIEYSTYLLRKVQNRVLTLNKEVKEGNIKKCLVSLKWEFEQLLDKYVNLNKEIEYFQVYYKTLTALSKKIEEGDEILKVLRETEFDSLLKSLLSLFSGSINQLPLVDIDKCLVDKAFRENIWGSGSEVEICLKKIDSVLSKDKAEVSKIAGELIEIKKLCMDNAVMRERFNSIFKIVSKEIIDTNYKLFTGTVKKVYEERENNKNDNWTYLLNYDFEFVYSDLKPTNPRQLSLSFPNLESSFPVLPNSSSTPQQNKKTD